MQQKSDVLIIGAGLSGLYLAYKLKKLGLDVKIVEKTARLGGNFDSRTYRQEESPFETVYEYGPNTFTSNYASMMQLVKELGLESELLRKDFSQSKRYLFKDESMIEVSSNPLMFLSSPLMSSEAKLRLLLEPFKRKEAEDADDEPVYAFINRKFGKEAAGIAASFLRGVWGADARRLSAKSALKKLTEMEDRHGSIILGAISNMSKKKKGKMQICSFRNGMKTLCEKLADAIGRENIFLSSDHKEFDYSVRVIATKAFEAAEIVGGIDSSLKKIKYASIHMVTLRIAKNKFKKPLNGFGFLSHIDSGLDTLGTIWASELFTERQLPEEYLLTSYLSPEEMVDPELLQGIAIQEQIRVLRDFSEKELKAEDFEFVDSKFIRKAIPQYEVGYQHLLKNIEDELLRFDNTFLLGNYLGGVSLVDSIEYADQVSQKIWQYFYGDSNDDVYSVEVKVLN